MCVCRCAWACVITDGCSNTTHIPHFTINLLKSLLRDWHWHDHLTWHTCPLRSFPLCKIKKKRATQCCKQRSFFLLRSFIPEFKEVWSEFHLDHEEESITATTFLKIEYYSYWNHSLFYILHQDPRVTLRISCWQQHNTLTYLVKYYGKLSVKFCDKICFFELIFVLFRYFLRTKSE